jgi:predicted transcriptional regulator YdeE/DNA-binding transcriptional MerR regulator
MLKIGEFSRLAQVSIKTLRYYDEVGLLRPEWVDRFSGYRYYSLEQLPRLNRILALRELGFPLVQIAQLLRDDLPTGELQRLMRLRQAELSQQVQEEQARLARVAARLRLIEQEGRQPRYEVLLKRIPPMRVAGIRDTIAEPEDLDELFAELRAKLGSAVLDREAGVVALAVYYDAEPGERGADVEAAVPLGNAPAGAFSVSRLPSLRSRGRIAVHELPAVGAMACVVHPGRREQMGAAYRALAAWTQANAYLTLPPSREVYLGTESTVTELQYPVQPLSELVSQGLKKGQTMEPRIVTRPAFTVVGVPFAGFISHSPYEGEAGNNEIGKTWDAFNTRAPEIAHISGPAIGLCFGMPNAEEPWYIAGIEVSQAEDVPAGMMRMDVPARKYAVFGCTLGTLGATYRYITEEWEPRSGHRHAAAPDFELYDESFDPNDSQNGKLDVYWPIE